MLKSVFPKNEYIIITLKAVMLLVVLLTAYYFLFLKPSLEIPNALIDAEKALSRHYNILVENRVAFTGITRLDANSGNLEEEKGNILAKLKITNEEGLKGIENPQQLKLVKGSPNETLNFLNKDLHEAYASLLAKSKNIYDEQKRIIESLTAYEIKVSKLFSYDPRTDFEKLDFQKQKEEVLERLANAKSGLSKIKDDLTKSEEKSSYRNSVREIDNTIGVLTQFEDSLKTDNYEEIPNIKNALYVQFDNVKKSALDSEMSIIMSPASVELLTDETNLILEYEYWITKIRDVLAKINERK